MTTLTLWWRTNLDLKLYETAVLTVPYSEIFQYQTSGPTAGQYNVAEILLLQSLPRGFLLSYPQVVMIQTNDTKGITPYLFPHIFRRWCPCGPAYIITASP